MGVQFALAWGSAHVWMWHGTPDTCVNIHACNWHLHAPVHEDRTCNFTMGHLLQCLPHASIASGSPLHAITSGAVSLWDQLCCDTILLSAGVWT